MANYVYPAVFHPNEDDSSITVIVPDLPGCITEGKDLADALFMAEDAVSMWVCGGQPYSQSRRHPAAPDGDPGVCQPGPRGPG